MMCAPDAEVKKENAKRYLARQNVGKAETSRPAVLNHTGPRTVTVPHVPVDRYRST